MVKEDDVEQFMAIRRHVKRLQSGTPLLLRSISASGQENLQICTFSVSQDLQILRWRDQEGSGTVHEVPLSQVTSVEEDRTAGSPSDGESHFALKVKLLPNSTSRSMLTSMELICCSLEDLESWRDGLKFLVFGPASLISQAAQSSVPPSPSLQRGRQLDETDELRKQLRLKEELCQKLEQENSMLREIVKRKDSTIAELVKDNQNRAAGADRCNKTESTSRESDEHLKFREVAILRRKNTRLQKDLKAKQQTVSDLLKLLGQVTQQQGAESSAQEETAAEDVDDDDDEEEAPSASPSIRGSIPRTAATLAIPRAPPPTASVSRDSLVATQATRPAAAAGSTADDDDDDVDVSQVFGDMTALMSKLELLEKLATAATEGGPSQLAFQPPPRGGSSQSNGVAPVKADAGVTATGPCSKAALEALSREMALLEEKKRVVERLARTLEPASDGDDEEDGFPLR